MDDQSIENLFGATGPLAAGLAAYRPRPQQIEMAQAVEQAIRRREHLIVEAGTGIGKSFGYLVPAIMSSVPQGRRILVSTNTISLQEQLIDKDLPVLKELLPVSFSTKLAKGRANYLSPRRLEVAVEVAAQSLHADQMVGAFRRLGEEVSRTLEGTRQELATAPAPDLWEQVQSEHGNCLRQACEHYARDCYYHVTRRQLWKADVIVVNHSLLLADLQLRRQGGRILPEHDVAIIDEAHTFEAVAFEHLGVRVSAWMVKLLLRRLYHPKRRRGVLTMVTGTENVIKLVSRADAVADDFFERVTAFCGGGSRTREIGGGAFIEDSLSSVLRELSAAVARLLPAVQSKETEVELRALAERLTSLSVEIRDSLASPGEGRVHWAQTGARPGQVELHARPLDISGALREGLFDAVGSVILTSATLSTGARDGLDYIARSLGVEGARKLQLGSPFDFASRVTLRVPVELSDPVDSPEYDAAVATILEHYVAESGGGAFLLFTSYDFMRRIHARLEPVLTSRGLPVFLQGADLSRAAMVEGFRATNDAVLFGADSFWQGVDVAGDALRLVAIVRLPFPVPSQPLHRARSRLIEARGGSSFRELSLPEAVIRFKQGFGRLIRRETDEGTVVVIDTRILNRSYGRAFLDALPAIPIVRDRAVLGGEG